jgi:hypothetical protein
MHTSPMRLLTFQGLSGARKAPVVRGSLRSRADYFTARASSKAMA